MSFTTNPTTLPELISTPDLVARIAMAACAQNDNMRLADITASHQPTSRRARHAALVNYVRKNVTDADAIIDFYSRRYNGVPQPTAPIVYGAAEATADIQSAGLPNSMIVVICRAAFVEAGKDGAVYRKCVQAAIDAYHHMKAIQYEKNATQLQRILKPIVA